MKQITPQHIAIIMDGNRRWARKNKTSLLMGHKTGAQNIEPLVKYAEKKGIRYLTLWAFSTENWKRSRQEVKTLMEVFRKALHDPMIQRLKEHNVKISIIGDMKRFPKDIQKDVLDVIQTTEKNTGIRVNIALNYGGRTEILRAVNQLIQEEKKEITEEQFSSYLYTYGQPDPDLIIRTGGEQRVSGYLPWQSVYSELYFTNTYWPDFDTTAFDSALENFANRHRRFGV